MNPDPSQGAKSKRSPLRIARIVSLSVLGVFLAIQFVPYGRNHSNPPVRSGPSWDSARTEALARRACYACHSNETAWPWYSHVAPMSWLVQSHVDEGRSHLNFSEFDRPQKDADEAAEEVAEGQMPLSEYRWMHAEARLNARETADLVRGLRATLGGESEEEDEG